MTNQPDREEKIIRFVCGALVGALGAFFGLMSFELGSDYLLGAVVLISLLCGFLAMHYGDSFWRFFSGLFHWW